MAAKKKPARKPASKSKKGQTQKANRQLKSILWFAVAVFLLFVALIPGKNVWLSLHNFFFGLFGLTTYFYPLLLGAVAVLYSMEKNENSLRAKVIESGILLVLIGIATDVFIVYDQKSDFFRHINTAFKEGPRLKSGGFFGALFGHPARLSPFCY